MNPERADVQRSGGVTLIDMLVGMAACWALPSAGRALGLAQPWIALLTVVNAIAAMLWAFYSKKLWWYLFFRGRDQNQDVSTAVVLAEVASMLLLTATLQYGIYLLVLRMAQLLA